jgi:hypothetical protein
MGVKRNAYWVLVRKPEGMRPQVPGVDDRIILNVVLKSYDGKAWTGFLCLGTGVQLAICSEHSDEASLCIKRGEFLGWVRNCSLLKRHSAPWS